MGAYDLPSGGWGMLALWGGLFVQASVIVLLVGMADGATAQTAGTVAGVYFLSMGIYFAIDIAWVMLLELRLNNFFFDASGFERPILQRALLLPTFFLYAAAANTFVVILPALDAAGSPDYWLVALRAFLLGWFAYGNLALVQAWSYERYPLEIVGLMPLSGGALSCFASLLTVVFYKEF